MATTMKVMLGRKRARYRAEYRAEAFALAERIGVAAAGSNLRLHSHRSINGERPDEKWAGDITYLRTTHGWLYLAVVRDLSTCKVIGWATSTRIDAELACTALQTAIARRDAPRGGVIYAHCGSVHRGLRRRHGLLSLGEITG